MREHLVRERRLAVRHRLGTFTTLGGHVLEEGIPQGPDERCRPLLGEDHARRLDNGGREHGGDDSTSVELGSEGLHGVPMDTVNETRSARPVNSRSRRVVDAPVMEWRTHLAPKSTMPLLSFVSS